MITIENGLSTIKVGRFFRIFKIIIVFIPDLFIMGIERINTVNSGVSKDFDIVKIPKCKSVLMAQKSISHYSEVERETRTWNLETELKNYGVQTTSIRMIWLRSYLFQDRPYQTGRMTKVIRIFIVLCC